MQGRFGEGRALALDHLVTWMTPLCPWPRIADDLQGNILREQYQLQQTRALVCPRASQLASSSLRARAPGTLHSLPLPPPTWSPAMAHLSSLQGAVRRLVRSRIPIPSTALCPLTRTPQPPLFLPPLIHRSTGASHTSPASDADRPPTHLRIHRRLSSCLVRLLRVRGATKLASRTARELVPCPARVSELALHLGGGIPGPIM